MEPHATLSRYIVVGPSGRVQFTAVLLPIPNRPALAARFRLGVKEMKEGEQPKSTLGNFLGFFSFFQFLVAISAITRIFGRILVAQFAKCGFSLSFLQQCLIEINHPLCLRVSTHYLAS
jgi:hypothetical protein